MFARALAAAALALLISGDVARLGWDAAGPWHLVFPYLWLFVLLEGGRARRRIEDGEVFLAGAAMAMLYGGVYAKDLQHGFHPLGIDWLGALCAAFDGGMTTVLALHVAVRFRPRGEVEPKEMGMLPIIFLIFCFAAAVSVYGVKTAFNFYRADRMLGPAWLIADILFVFVAWTLARRARARSEEDAETGRESWVWSLAAFAVWLPGARFIARACAASGLPGAFFYFSVGAWTVVLAGLCRRLRAALPTDLGSPKARSGAALAAVLWRAAGALILAVCLGADRGDARAAGLFSAMIDWPSRALFAWVFLTARLKV